jgi:hypothetical protein
MSSTTTQYTQTMNEIARARQYAREIQELADRMEHDGEGLANRGPWNEAIWALRRTAIEKLEQFAGQRALSLVSTPQQPDPSPNSADYVLANGTPVWVHHLSSTMGILVDKKFLDNRRAGIRGVVWGGVPGHDAEVYWVRHADGGSMAPYARSELRVLGKEYEDQEEPHQEDHQNEGPPVREPDYDLTRYLKYNQDVFTLEDITNLHALVPGHNDEYHWFWVIELRDGRFLLTEAWCDYTGWDCQSGGQTQVAPSSTALSAATLAPWEHRGRSIRANLVAQVDGRQPYGLETIKATTTDQGDQGR